MAEYKLTNSNSVWREADGAFIPEDSRNRDYREYREWVSQGRVPDPADPPPDNSSQHECNNLLLRLSTPLLPADVALKANLLNIFD